MSVCMEESEKLQVIDDEAFELYPFSPEESGVFVRDTCMHQGISTWST